MAGETPRELRPEAGAGRSCRRQGSGVPLRPLPRRRHRARAGNALDRRGHRPRPLLRRSPSPRASSAAATKVPTTGAVFVSVRDVDKPRVLDAVQAARRPRLQDARRPAAPRAFSIEQGIPAQRINKVSEGRPHVVDAIKNGGIQLVFNTTEGAQALADSRSLRRAALLHKVPYYTTLAGAIAAARGHQGLSRRRSRSARAAGLFRLRRGSSGRTQYERLCERRDAPL